MVGGSGMKKVCVSDLQDSRRFLYNQRVSHCFEELEMGDSCLV